MKRFILQQLIEWKNREDRKPLILNGARQVGKTVIQKQEQQKARISDLMERRNEKQEKQPAPSVTQTDNQTIPAVTQPFSTSCQFR